MARDINNSKSKKSKTEEKRVNKMYTISSLVYCVMICLLYKNDNIILFNLKSSIYLFICGFLYFVIFIILQLFKLVKDNFERYLFPLIITFFLSVPIYYIIKIGLSNFTNSKTELYYAEILDLREGKKRRGGKYFKIDVKFNDNIESVNLSEYQFNKLKSIKLNENHAVIKYRKSILDIYIIDTINFQSKLIKN